MILIEARYLPGSLGWRESQRTAREPLQAAGAALLRRWWKVSDCEWRVEARRILASCRAAMTGKAEFRSRRI